MIGRGIFLIPLPIIPLPAAFTKKFFLPGGNGVAAQK